MTALFTRTIPANVRTSLDVSTECAVLFATVTSGDFEVTSCVLLPSGAGLLASAADDPAALLWPPLSARPSLVSAFAPATAAALPFTSADGASLFSRKLPSQTAACASRKISRNTKNFSFWIFDRVIVPCHLSGSGGGGGGDDDDDTATASSSFFFSRADSQRDGSAFRRVLHVARRPARTASSSRFLPDQLFRREAAFGQFRVVLARARRGSPAHSHVASRAL